MKKKLKYVISGFQKPDKGWDEFGITHEMKLLFVNYMLKESGWKDCFLNPDAEDVVANHWLLNINIPTNLLVNAGFATRFISEFPRKFRVWVELVEAGVDKNEAFFIAHFVQSAPGDKLYPVKVNCPGGHVFVKDSFDKKYFQNFVEGKPVNLSKSTYAEELTYNRVNDVWGTGYGVDGYKFNSIAPRVKAEENSLDIFFDPLKEMKRQGWSFKSLEELLCLVQDIKSIILKG